jgi:uncharacterized protein
MSVTDSLLKLFRVDRQLAGLEGRFKAAERFLDEQTRLIEQIDAKAGSVRRQLKLLQASAADREGEVARLDGRIAQLRDRLDSSHSNKEYQAVLTEINTLKADRDRAEETAIEQLGKADELKAQLGELEAQRAEREKVRKVAEEERDKRRGEVQGRIDELKAERAVAAKGVPGEVRGLYERLLSEREGEAMAPIEEQDRRRHEYTCGACMMAVPIESVSALLSQGRVVTCVSCGCILYMEKELAADMSPAKK